MDCNFLVGQKVVCVDDSPLLGRHALIKQNGHLAKGKIYTIERIYKSRGVYKGIVEDAVVLSLAEIKKVTPHNPVDDGYHCLRFRPVVKRKSDISIFTNMLRDVYADA